MAGEQAIRTETIDTDQVSWDSSADWHHLAARAARVVDGDDDAWREFVGALEPRLHALVRWQRIGPLRRRVDDRRNIVVAVIGKLHRDDKRALRRYFAMEAPPSFRRWLLVVVRSCAIDYMRGHAEYKRAEQADRWVALETLRTGEGYQAQADTLEQKRRKVLADIRDAVALAATVHPEAVAEQLDVDVNHARRLGKRAEQYEPVLNLLFQGCSYREIASQLDLSKRDVELVVRYAEEFLKDRYGVRDD